ncbi:MAG: hypothetical protein K6D03_11555 [Solobacterium sp.]|nr:hypothetical protein [Solobacterium sp.]
MKIIMNLLASLSALYGIYGIMKGTEKGKLLEHGLRCLKYFTVLSNLLAMLVTAADVIFLSVTPAGTQLPAVLSYLNFMAAVSVGLTFMTVMVYLGRLYGYAEMLKGPNFHLHLSAPLLTVFCFLFFLPLSQITFAGTFIATLPMILYGIWYLANLLVNGTENNDWYGFARGGMKTMPVVYAAMFLFTWIISVVLWLIRF